jgi:hypothetical protein
MKPNNSVPSPRRSDPHTKHGFAALFAVPDAIVEAEPELFDAELVTEVVVAVTELVVTLEVAALPPELDVEVVETPVFADKIKPLGIGRPS